VPLHTRPTALHTGSALHEHRAVPALPVQLSCVPHDVWGLYDQQPGTLDMQVARPPEMQVVWPCTQLFVQLAAHVAFGASPEHDWLPVHGDDDSTKGQPSPSTMHVTSVWLSWQAVPAALQIEDVQLHAEALPVPVHVAWAPQFAVVVHPVHPLGCVAQTWMLPPPGAHRMVPALQAS
jgi:hypothetical protein